MTSLFLRHQQVGLRHRKIISEKAQPSSSCFSLLWGRKINFSRRSITKLFSVHDHRRSISRAKKQENELFRVWDSVNSENKINVRLRGFCLKREAILESRGFIVIGILRAFARRLNNCKYFQKGWWMFTRKVYLNRSRTDFPGSCSNLNKIAYV